MAVTGRKPPRKGEPGWSGPEDEPSEGGLHGPAVYARSHSGGFSLDGLGAAGPKTKEEGQPKAVIDYARGMEAGWRQTPSGGSVHDSPFVNDALIWKSIETRQKDTITPDFIGGTECRLFQLIS